jgi:hypothetical protein
MPGMAWIDHDREIATEEGDIVTVRLGYCEKCGGLYITCPRCGDINAVSEWREGEWECEGGCGLEWNLAPMMTKDDLSGLSHDRLTLRL